MIRKILCFIGWHSYTASHKDYIEQFGYIPLDGRIIADNAVCKFCGKPYKDK